MFTNNLNTNLETGTNFGSGSNNLNTNLETGTNFGSGSKQPDTRSKDGLTNGGGSNNSPHRIGWQFKRLSVRIWDSKFKGLP